MTPISEMLPNMIARGVSVGRSAVVAGSSVLVPLTVLPSQRHARVVEVITGGVVATFIVGVTLLWLTRWPTRRQSQAILVVGALSIAAWSLVQPTGPLPLWRVRAWPSAAAT